MSAAPSNQTTLTLGELLYANPAVTRVSEKEWLALIHAVAAGDQGALRLLHEKTQPLVATYLMRLTGDRRLTDELILDIFEIVWCEAPVFVAADGPVIGWIMRHARAHALNHARVSAPPTREPEQIVDDTRLRKALEALTKHEREVIEATFLNGISYAEMAAQRGEPIGTIKSRIRSGLTKLQQALQALGEES